VAHLRPLFFVVLAGWAFFKCQTLWTQLGQLPDSPLAHDLRDQWYWFSVAGMALIVLALGVAGLLLPGRQVWVWVLVGAAVVALVATAVWYFGFRRAR
jgi:hypothetical protein